MPPPPPPPPGPGPPKPPAVMKVAKSGPASDRNALLSSIQNGAKLRKTVTNDRSCAVGAVKSPSSGTVSSSGGSASISSSPSAGGGAPQLAGLFAGGMPKLRPTGKGRLGPINGGVKPSTLGVNRPSVPPALPPARKPAPIGPHTLDKPMATPSAQRQNSSPNPPDKLSPNINGYLPPSPKPSMKSNPAPPPPPTSRKPSNVQDRPRENRNSFNDSSSSYSKPAPPRPPTVNGTSANTSNERNPPLPAKPAGLLRAASSTRGAPPRPPSDTKPNIVHKISNQNGDVRRPSIDRSKSMREPSQNSHLNSYRVGTSAESPAAPYRTLAAHSNRPAPPIPTVGPTASKTVGRMAGSTMLSNLRPPSEKPPKPPNRPSIIAPPPPSQPPPPPPPHKVNSQVLRQKSSTARTEVSHSGPPLPPERIESTRLSNRMSGSEFEFKYSNLFKSRHKFPSPIVYNNNTKSYPSKNNGTNQRRAPQPPSSANQSSNHSFLHHTTPPPPPPHAPLHIQVGSKLYGTETSQC